MDQTKAQKLAAEMNATAKDGVTYEAVPYGNSWTWTVMGWLHGRHFWPRFDTAA